MYYGQFIYDFQDNAGNLHNTSSENPIGKNLVNPISSSKKVWDKIGVQGPSGMTFYINEPTLTFVIGPSGIYEMENVWVTNFTITSLGSKGLNDHYNIIVDYRGY